MLSSWETLLDFSIGLRPGRVQALDYEDPCETGKTWGVGPCHETPGRQSSDLGWIDSLAPALVGIGSVRDTT